MERLVLLAAVEVEAETDFRRGSLEGEGGGMEGRGAVIAAFVDERRRFGGIVDRAVLVESGGRVWNINRQRRL